MIQVIYCVYYYLTQLHNSALVCMVQPSQYTLTCTACVVHMYFMSCLHAQQKHLYLWQPFHCDRMTFPAYFQCMHNGIFY